MINIDHLTARLKRHEGTRKKKGVHIPYTDSTGNLTIGYGRNLSDHGISETEASYLLATDIQNTMNALYKALPWIEVLDDVRQEVLIEMAFNLGVKDLLGFHKTLQEIKYGDYHTAAQMMLQSLWAEQVGTRALELSMAMDHGTFEENPS